MLATLAKLFAQVPAWIEKLQTLIDEARVVLAALEAAKQTKGGQ